MGLHRDDYMDWFTYIGMIAWTVCFNGFTHRDGLSFSFSL